MKCFYHKVDLDGKCSAAIVRSKYPQCELIPIDYGDEIVCNIEPTETIFIVDFSFSHSTMIDLIQRAQTVCWIDHHKRTFEELEQDPTIRALPGLRVDGKAACELCWEYLRSLESLPYGVKLIGRYDVWDKDFQTVANFFNCGMGIYNASPDNDTLWHEIFKDNIEFANLTIDHGQIIDIYRRMTDSKYCQTCCQRIRWLGYSCLLINKACSNSSVADSISEQYDICILFSQHSSGAWRVGLYSETIDVSEIATRFGGGEHKGAAGFECERYENLPWIKEA